MGLISRVSSRTYRYTQAARLLEKMSHISKCTTLKQIKTVIFDCDGVLWLLNDLLPGAIELVRYLKANNIRTFFVSNNSTKTTAQYLEKFTRLGFDEGIEASQVISAARISAKCLHDRGIKKAFVVGAEAIDYEMAQYGVEAVRHKEELAQGNIEFELDADVQAVLAGMDQQINYQKL